MRGRDLFGLALEAVGQSKTRTLLTLAGVALGAGMLVVSLSLSHGMRGFVEAQYRKDDRLRTVLVRAGWQPAPLDEAAIPSGEIEVRGEVSDERRQRLRRYLIQRYRDQQPPQTVTLTADRLDALARLEHVTAVAPQVHERAEFEVNGAPRVAQLWLMPPGHRKLGERLVYGRLPEPDRPEALVPEVLLFHCGLVADADVQGFLGRTLRLEVKDEQGGSPYQLLNLLGARVAGLTPSSEEVRLLSTLTDKLPAALAGLDLPPEQGRLLKSLLERSRAGRAPDERPRRAAGEFTVVGVYHHDRPEERDWLGIDPGASELVLSARPGQELFARLPRYAENGFDGAVVTVDREDHVRGVTDELKRMGLRTNSLAEWAELAMQEVTLIGLGMTVLSVLALVVAGLGITNTMVTSVLERTHDIGVMKAVGARDRQVLGLFLIEGAVLGLVGGGLGLLGAWLFTLSSEGWVQRVMEQQSQQKIQYTIFRFPPWLLTGAPLFAVLVTTAAALIPARRAARIDPAVTLRTE